MIWEERENMEAIWSESIINPFPLFLILTKEEGKGKKLGDNMKKRYLSSFSSKKNETTIHINNYLYFFVTFVTKIISMN
jgi:hypothetical protein